MKGATLVLLSALLVTGAAAGDSLPSASKPPASLRAGQLWTVTVRPPQPASTRFDIRQGRRARSFPLVRSRAGVTFPREGRWVYGLRSGARFRKLGTAVVRQRRLVLAEPFDAVEAGPWIVISDRRRGAVYRLHRATGAWARVAEIAEARELEPVGETDVLVTSGERVVRLDLGTGVTSEVARAADVVLGLVVSGEALFASEGSAIVRLEGGRRDVLARSLDGVHGLLLRGNRLLAAETFAGRILELDRDGGAVSTLAGGLRNPSSLAPAPDGGVYVSEFEGGRVSLVDRDGGVRGVASVPQAGALWPAADGSLLVTVLGGDVVRVDPRTGRSRSALD